MKLLPTQLMNTNFRLLFTLALVLLCALPLSARNRPRLHFELDGVKFDMVLVEGGKFTMGATAEQAGYSDDEHPLHEVRLSDYYIGETEVTQELWTAVMGENPSYFQLGGNYPVERVSWFDVQVFLKKLNHLCLGNFELPTEAQWEYAARGGQKSRDCRYAGSDVPDSVAWFGAGEPPAEGAFSDTIFVGSYLNSKCAHTYPVAQKQPNELGLYDMSGNVAEWTSTFYAPYTDRKVKNPKGPTDGDARVFRGGCWCLGDFNCRVSCRQRALGGFRYVNLGFRLVLPTWSQVTPSLFGSDTIVIGKQD